MITAKDYDARVVSEGLQHQIDTYYVPREACQRRRIEAVLRALRPREGETILDVGCGVGTFAFHCAKAGARSFGLDYSVESLEAAGELCRRFGAGEEASFAAGIADALPYRTGVFDKIVAADFIEHITADEKSALLKEMRRVLKPGGMVVVFTPNLARERIGGAFWRLRARFFKQHVPVTALHFGLIGREDFERLCRTQGFTFVFRYEDVTRPYLARLPILRRFLALNLLWVLRKAPGA